MTLCHRNNPISLKKSCAIPIIFDFLTLPDQAAERELEEGLLAHIRKFLIELGAGFAFVGQQVHLEELRGRISGGDYCGNV